MSADFDFPEAIEEAVRRWGDNAEFKVRAIATSCFEHELTELGQHWNQIAEAIHRANMRREIT